MLSRVAGQGSRGEGREGGHPEGFDYAIGGPAVVLKVADGGFGWLVEESEQTYDTDERYEQVEFAA